MFYWIRKSEFMAKYILTPIFAVFMSKNPTFIIFCFDYEYPVLRDNYMVYLR